MSWASPMFGRSPPQNLGGLSKPTGEASADSRFASKRVVACPRSAMVMALLTSARRHHVRPDRGARPHDVAHVEDAGGSLTQIK